MQKDSFSQFNRLADLEAGLELRQVLHPLLKWWWTLLFVPLLCSATAYYLMQSSPRYYQAQTVLQFGLPLSQANNQLPLPPLPLLGPTYKELVMSEQFLKVVAAQPGINQTVPELQEAIIAYHTYWTTTIEIQATTSSPTQTLAILNTVNSLLFTQTPELTQLRLNFISQRQTELQNQNNALQQQIDSLTRQLDAPANDANANVITATLNDLRNQMDRNNAESQGLDFYLTRVESYQLHADLMPTLINLTLGPKPLDAAVALWVVGLALTVLLIYLFEKLGNFIYSVQEIENITGQQAALVLDRKAYKGSPSQLAQAWDLLASEIVATYFNTKSSILLTVLYDQPDNISSSSSSNRNKGGISARHPVQVAALADALSRLGVKTTINSLKSFGNASSLFSNNELEGDEDLYTGETGRILECGLVGLAWPTAPHILRYLSSRSVGLIVLFDLNRSKKSSLNQLARSIKMYANPRNIKTIVQV